MKINTQVSRRSGMTIRSSLKEAGKPLSGGSSKFRVRLIQEGIGNLGDCFYYSKPALQNAAELFEGKKCFANHPDELEQEIRPERSIRDIVGHFENVIYEEAAGRGMLTADLVTVPGSDVEWATSLLTTSIDYAKKYPDSDFVGLSINASGDADEVPIEEFLKGTDIPTSVLPKLQKAQSMGVSSIKVVNALNEAKSVDIVTDAGAGGKILQMLESEREKKMKKESSEKKEEKKEKEAEKKEASIPGAEGGNPEDGADAGQDMTLFKQMVQQFLGDDHADDQDAHSMGKEAYEACKEDGMEHEAAYEAAGKHLQLSKKIGMKKAGAAEAEKKEGDGMEKKEAGEMEKKEADPDATAPPAAGGDDPAAPPAKMKKKVETHYESEKELRAKLITANGEISKLKESLKKYELAEYIDAKCKEAKVEGRKMEMSASTKFKEALGALKSKEQIDSGLKLFIAACESRAAGSEEFDSFVMTEKRGSYQTDHSADGDMSDCLEK